MKKLSGGMLILLTVAFALPLAALVYLSLRWGNGLSLEQYRRALSDAAFLRRLSCSCRITLLSLAFHLPVALICGLLLARGRFRGRRGLQMLFVLALLLPFQVIMLPVYKMSLAANLYDSFWSVVLLAAFAPLGTLISVVLIRGVPESQWEAAALETNSLFETMRLVILPQILPGLAVLGLLVFADAWNMVEQPLILLPTPEKRPLSLAFNDILKTDTDYLYAGSALYALPIVAVYFLLFGLSARQRKR